MVEKAIATQSKEGCMKRSTSLLSFVMVLLVASVSALGATKTFTGPGIFSDAAKWSGGTLPTATDTLAINGVCTFDNAASTLAYQNLIVGASSAGTLQWPVGGTNTLNVLSVRSTVAGSTIDMTNGGTLQIRSSWLTANQAFTPGTGTINWNVTSGASDDIQQSDDYCNRPDNDTGRCDHRGWEPDHCSRHVELRSKQLCDHA
jgi:hypothetical protein